MIFRICLSLLLASVASADDPRTLFVTRSMAHEQLLPYIEAARPEIVQIGQYGAMFHGYADDEKSKGTPMKLPFHGEKKVLAFQRDLNAKIHDLGLKAVGHFRLVKAYGSWEERTGFVDYYNNRWPEDILGPKPHADLRELLQRDAAGEPVQVSRYGQGQIAFCLSSPHARQMFKQMLKVAVDHGVDGVITTFNYHFNCSCPHCQSSFRSWLDERDLKFEFETIPARIGGSPDPAEATELDWVAMRWAAENFKKNYDDVFIDYGRSLEPDLLVAQWNHMSHVSKSEERMFLPIEQWGKGESYFWESGGASFVGEKLNLKEGMAGDAWLSCLVIRELGGGTPFVMGKYDGLRMAASMAEGYATGGLGMGRYMRFEQEEGFEKLVQYTKFRHEHEALYAEATPLADVALVLPRQTLWRGQPGAMDDFRDFGQELLNEQLLVDVVADELLSAERLKNARVLILPYSTKLSDEEAVIVEAFEGQVLRRDDGVSVEQARDASAIKIDAPWTVRAAAYRQDTNRVILHLVNYNRDEGETKEERGKMPKNERPIAVEDVVVRLEEKPRRVRIYQPEVQEALEIPVEADGDGTRFTIPNVLVYGVVEIELSP